MECHGTTEEQSTMFGVGIQVRLQGVEGRGALLEVWGGFRAEKGEIQMKREWYGSRAVTGGFGKG